MFIFRVLGMFWIFCCCINNNYKNNALNILYETIMQYIMLYDAMH